MTCPVCGGETLVIDKRNKGCDVVRRRRECKECSYRFTTEEMEVEIKRKKEVNKK